MGKDAVWSGVPSVKGKTEFQRMVLLTSCLLGLQLCWGLEMTYGMPYLLSLGLSKSSTSLVWIAGPLSGIITAPVIGAIADQSKSRFGRRRPFMLYGSLAVAVCFWALAWAREIVQVASPYAAESANRHLTIGLAVTSIYIVDFAINVVQWSSRSLIVDTLPTSQQQLGSAWASRMSAFGHLFGYGVGALDLEQVFGGMIGDTQFKRMAVLSAVSMFASVGVSCWAVQEKVLISDADGARRASNPSAVFKQIYRAILSMPPKVRAICWVQFCAWVGWFPFLFYGAEWVGEIYFRHEAPAHVHETTDKTAAIGRIGSTALLAFSGVTFMAMTFLPSVIKSPADEEKKHDFTPRPPASLAPLVEAARKELSKPELLTAWTWSHVMFGSAMVFAPFVKSVRFAAVLVAFCGIPWAFTSWAPFAFMGVEINKMSVSSNVVARRHRRDSIDLEKLEHDPSAGGALAGIYLGILNVFTAGPQLFASLLSMAVFSMLEPGEGAGEDEGRADAGTSERPNSIGVCLFLGAWFAFGAAYMARRLRQLDHDER